MAVGVLVMVLFVVLLIVVLLVAVAVWTSSDKSSGHKVDPYRTQEQVEPPHDAP